ncbi:MAG: ParB/RepB/Spo0J family partition protein [Deltaproteobacteria bacterium]|nr:ParB/RepB/Spo0J family partition protein [Deltaproteobacteria bacterium]
MSNPHNALGRGIGALIPGVAPASSPAPAPEAGPTRIPLDAIEPNPDQPRRVFDPKHLERMAKSISRHGVLQPVVVRKAGGRYQLICGEQRWRAARLAGLSSIPAVVTDVDDQDRLELALIENVQRADLNPIELAHAFKTLCAAGATQEEVGERVSLDRSTVANHLRILELPKEFQADIEAGRLSIGHAKALLSMGNPERRRQLRDRIVREGLSVRSSEGIARDVSKPKRPRTTSRSAVDPNRQMLVDNLRRRLQTSVRINGEDARGRIEIEYFGAEDLGRIANMLLGDA